MFKVKNFNDLNTFVSDAKTKCVKGRSITLIDTPGLFDQGRSKGEVKPELMRCFIECAPGPHIFLIVLRMERYSEQEQAITNEILHYFSEDILKYAVVVFTHGDQLQEGMEIGEYVSQSEALRGLVEKCGSRCHVFDCKYWKNREQESNYRSNQFQVGELLVTIDKLLMENTGGFYTNVLLEEMEREIQEEAQRLKLSSNNTSEEEIRQLAKTNILKKQMKGTALWIKGSAVVLMGLLAAVSVWFISSRVRQTSSVAKAGEAAVPSIVKAAEPIASPAVEAGKKVDQSASLLFSVFFQAAREGPWALHKAFTTFYDKTCALINSFV